uniref:Channelrhodopsin-2 n=1 Tax=Volvox carteri f. nagariensis TaxID=3068 RepID=B4Y105_VOLCA|nr:channelrhodopsin-2 [Volvox carteri f. nagariensis]ABZ90903.1 channelrhodopsin-2 [Volvox carteri f. nagariensis]
MDHPVARSLIGSSYTNLNNGSIVIPSDACFCMKWLKSKGSPVALKMANALQWAAFALSVIILIYYAYATWRTTCGWEEVYVCCVELTKVVIEFFHEFDEPGMLYLANGNRVLWLRYGEWLLTCPVILIHLSNLTGLKDDYNKRTMRLLVSDVGTIVWGATAAMSTGYIKVIFFLLGCMYGANTFFHAAKVYIESYHTVPKGLCRQLVRAMAWLFFVSWGMFPVLFLLGPEGFGHLSVYGSTIGHTIIDLLSKNCWGLLGHFLRLKIHEHILLYGDIRKVQKIRVAGEELEVETLMTEEAPDTVKKSTAQYANRESFLTMRDKLKEKGFEVRASLDNSGIDAVINHNNNYNNALANAAAAVGKPGMELSKLDHVAANAAGMGGIADHVATTSGAISPGRVILAVPDISMVDYFREQFAQLPVQYEVVPALGADNAVQLVVQAAGLGGCDFVLLHPEFLRDKSSTSLPARLRSIGQRVAAFGWSPVGPVRDLIESAGLDGWLEGPSFGLGISLPNLASLVLRMQHARKMAAMLGGMGGMLGSNLMSGSGGVGLMGAGSPGGGGGAMGVGMTGMGMVGTNAMGRGAVGNSVANASMGGGSAGMGMGMMGMVGAGVGGQQQMGANGMGPTSFQLGSNPLYNTAPSPLSSQPGGDASAAAAAAAAAAATGAASNSMNAMQAGGSVRNSGILAGGLGSMMGPPGAPAAPTAAATAAPAVTMGAPGGGGAAASEAEMLQQLMAEINRLKSELGE